MGIGVDVETTIGVGVSEGMRLKSLSSLVPPQPVTLEIIMLGRRIRLVNSIWPLQG